MTDKDAKITAAKKRAADLKAKKKKSAEEQKIPDQLSELPAPTNVTLAGGVDDLPRLELKTSSVTSPSAAEFAAPRDAAEQKVQDITDSVIMSAVKPRAGLENWSHPPDSMNYEDAKKQNEESQESTIPFPKEIGADRSESLSYENPNEDPRKQAATFRRISPAPYAEYRSLSTDLVTKLKAGPQQDENDKLSLEEELRVLRASLCLAEKSLTDTKGDCAILQSNLQEAQQCVVELNTIVSRLHKSNECLEGELADLRCSYSQLQNEKEAVLAPTSQEGKQRTESKGHKALISVLSHEQYMPGPRSSPDPSPEASLQEVSLEETSKVGPPMILQTDLRIDLTTLAWYAEVGEIIRI